MRSSNKTWTVVYPGFGSGEGAGGCVMQTDQTVPEDHGGLEAGTDINGMKACDVLKLILFPYQYPQFTSFYIQGQGTTLEVGQCISAGSKHFVWSTSHSENVKENSISIKDVTANQVLAENLANDGSEDITIDEICNSTINGNHKWRITGVNTKNQTFSRDFDVYWRARVYWGSSANNTLTSDEVKNLANSALKPNFNGTYNFPNDNGTELYYYIVYPDSWGDYNSWKDTDSGFEVDATNAGTVDVTNDYNVTITYRLIRTTYKQTTALNSTMS